MKKGLVIGIGTVAIMATGVAVMGARYEPVLRPNSKVGQVDVGGLTKIDAAKKLRIWWEGERILPLSLTNSRLTRELPSMTPGALGVTLDDKESVDQLPIQSFVEAVKEKVANSKIEPQAFPVRYKKVTVDVTPLRKAVKASYGVAKPARVRYENGVILKEPEVSSLQLVADQLQDAVILALQSDRVVNLPLEESPKVISDAALETMNEVVSEFSTNFPHNPPRTSNIKLAASRINGTIIPAHGKFSFNQVVGERTLGGGFQVAGVYKNGRHDEGVGGGICQVSTTLYNAALFANLNIGRRSNHSMPVAYVPIGRDATVDYGSLDLVIENPYDQPLALTSEYAPGKLTFRVIGTKVPGLSIKLVSGPVTSWANGEAYVNDPDLPAGEKEVTERGSRGFLVMTYRHVYQDGQLVKTETLGRSRYPGGKKIIAVGTKGAKPSANTTPPSVNGGLIPPLPDGGN